MGGWAPFYFNDFSGTRYFVHSDEVAYKLIDRMIDGDLGIPAMLIANSRDIASKLFCGLVCAGIIF
ncbi:MAG: hypothetical protein H7831_17925, partial [Magnetococcus sp. WYHC-3]